MPSACWNTAGFSWARRSRNSALVASDTCQQPEFPVRIPARRNDVRKPEAFDDPSASSSDREETRSFAVASSNRGGTLRSLTCASVQLTSIMILVLAEVSSYGWRSASTHNKEDPSQPMSPHLQAPHL